MREIKFRAWDGEEMSNPFGLGDLHDGLVYQNDQAYDIEGKTIMQYTGLKDKNGKEIYEGDIVRWSPAIKKAEKWLVKQWEKTEEVIWCEKYTGWTTKTAMHALGLYSHVEVIGNIYENENLLELEEIR